MRLPDPAKVADRLLPARGAAMARATAHTVRDRRFPRRVVEHQYAGVSRRFVIASRYGERYDTDWAAPPELELLARGRLREGARVLDLGANHGVLALMLADVVGPRGFVLALEASARDVSAARETMALNGLRHVECRHAAVAERSGSVAFATNGEVVSSPRQARRSVPASSVDDLQRRDGPFDVIYIDVEGYEGRALDGASATLAGEADWFVELHGDADIGRFGGSNEAVAERFDRGRFDVYVAQGAHAIGAQGGIVHTARFGLLDDLAVLPRGRCFLVALNRGAALSDQA